jgi:hypothetical protein
LPNISLVSLPDFGANKIPAIAPMADKIIKFKNGKTEEVIVNKKPISIDKIEW